jgi:hypothetical protein
MRFLRIKVEPIRKIGVDRVSSFLAELSKAFFQSFPIRGIQLLKDLDEIENCKRFS